MPIVYEKILSTANMKDVIRPDRSLINFDFFNDTQWKIGINFDQDVGFNGCEYFIMPSGILTGLVPENVQLSVGKVTWGGTIWVYTSATQGGTPITNPPAQELTIVGYAKDRNPSSSYSMYRVGNIGNSVPVSIQATSLANNSNTTPSAIITIGESGTNYIVINSDGSATLSVLQSGVLHQVLNIQATGHPIQIGKSGDFSDILGNLVISGDTYTDGLIGVVSAGDVINASGFDTTLSARGSGNVVHLSSAGSDNATFDQNGIHLSRGTVNLLLGSLSKIKAGSGTTNGGTVTIAHGMGLFPYFAGCFINSTSGSATMGVTWDGTNVNVFCPVNGLPFVWFAWGS